MARRRTSQGWTVSALILDVQLAEDASLQLVRQL